MAINSKNELSETSNDPKINQILTDNLELKLQMLDQNILDMSMSMDGEDINLDGDIVDIDIAESQVEEIVKPQRTESVMDNLRTEATTPMLGTIPTYINTLRTDMSVIDVELEDRLAFANLNDEDLSVIDQFNQEKSSINNHKDDDKLSLGNVSIKDI